MNLACSPRIGVRYRSVTASLTPVAEQKHSLPSTFDHGPPTVIPRKPATSTLNRILYTLIYKLLHDSHRRNPEPHYPLNPLRSSTLIEAS
ncbi:uncharacterized protein MYCFIDRAFT_170830 [Pseudocercospora fijiensis CIRAD86]|uniref:Uncharacterized protein n=1 Tax=Pseudocercospora fijiensis (strain CIRAD86) TaxID=383855 RepID=N1Q922_PSEFD|nr:uncharacterized protein MYCFIDRAFT_170830 [Pseudocercospora fijiensis CIRAD86]EME89374.1 hypothetical protein MYCFIDRAFT_170830 [Pseudocercospora fijiensis CIRAD86]